MIYALLAAHRDDRAASLACLRELVRYFDGDLTDYVRQQRARYMAIVGGILRDGVDEGVFRTADPKMSALQIFGMCNYAWTWYQPDGSQSVEDIARLFARNILDGLARVPASARRRRARRADHPGHRHRPARPRPPSLGHLDPVPSSAWTVAPPRGEVTVHDKLIMKLPRDGRGARGRCAGPQPRPRRGARRAQDRPGKASRTGPADAAGRALG